jgi:hypothetical protein
MLFNQIDKIIFLLLHHASHLQFHPNSEWKLQLRRSKPDMSLASKFNISSRFCHPYIGPRTHFNLYLNLFRPIVLQSVIVQKYENMLTTGTNYQ